MMAYKILIVDDDPSLSGIIAEFLQSEGFETAWVGSAEEAYDALSCQAFDCLLLDINLPAASGFDVCEQVRRRTNVPIVFASARSSVNDEIVALDKGGDDYLSKPYSMRELLAHLKAVLRRSQHALSENGSIVRVHDIEIDCASQTARKKGRELELSPKEFGVLAYLARHAGTAVSTEELISEVWGAFSEVEPSTVAVHVRWLRQKIEDNPGNPQIVKTVRKVGYVLVEKQDGQAASIECDGQVELAERAERGNQTERAGHGIGNQPACSEAQIGRQ